MPNHYFRQAYISSLGAIYGLEAEATKNLCERGYYREPRFASQNFLALTDFVASASEGRNVYSIANRSRVMATTTKSVSARKF
jgi:hypothetical protein